MNQFYQIQHQILKHEKWPLNETESIKEKMKDMESQMIQKFYQTKQTLRKELKEGILILQEGINQTDTQLEEKVKELAELIFKNITEGRKKLQQEIDLNKKTIGEYKKSQEILKQTLNDKILKLDLKFTNSTEENKKEILKNTQDIWRINKDLGQRINSLNLTVKGVNDRLEKVVKQVKVNTIDINLIIQEVNTLIFKTDKLKEADDEIRKNMRTLVTRVGEIGMKLTER